MDKKIENQIDVILDKLCMYTCMGTTLHRTCIGYIPQ